MRVRTLWARGHRAGAGALFVSLAVGLLVTGVPRVTLGQRVARCVAAERIRAVEFRGSPAFDDLTMATGLVTHEPSFATRVLHIGTAPCLDSLELQRDALRLAVMHRQAGWFRATVAPSVRPVRGGVRVEFVITPGAPAILDSVQLFGVPNDNGGGRPVGEGLHMLAGQRLDRTRLDTTAAALLVRLRDLGYARARLDSSRIAIDTPQARASVRLYVDAGRVLTIGQLDVRVQPLAPGRPRVDSGDVARLARIPVGERFRGSALLDAQRTLYRADAFRLVLVDTVTPKSTARDSTIDIRISVAEARMRSARVGLGWATQDCVRTQGRVVDRGFLGVGRRLELTVRASKLGLGAPTDVAPALCSAALRTDPFSARVNYFVGTTFSDTRLFSWPVVPTLSVYSERRGEPFAYLRETSIGGLAELSRQFSTRTSGTGGVQYENGRTTTDPVVSCTRFGQCRPEDYVLSLFGRGVALLSGTLTHDRTNAVLDPNRGWRVRSEVRAGQTFSTLVSSLRFYRLAGEAAAYRSVGSGVIGVRIQASRAFAPGAELVDGAPLLPQQERLFAGGQNSVRGYQQNLLGPVVYVVSQVREQRNAAGESYIEVVPGASFDRAVPRGGTALAVANVEWRRGFRFIAEQFQLAAFIDAGSVWETHSDRFRWRDVRATPGLGVRVLTPLGPFRVDIGYRPYGLRTGRALYFAPGEGESDGQIRCASPRGNVADASDDIFACPATFAPPPRGALSRLVFHFGLGQAF